MNQYKRVVVSPLRYAGGKSLAVGFVVELLPDNLKRIISPFFGGGSIEIACNKYLNLEIIGYDIFDILINYWQIQIQNPVYGHDAEIGIDRIPPAAAEARHAGEIIPVGAPFLAA